jgi:hypothetical protein
MKNFLRNISTTFIVFLCPLALFSQTAPNLNTASGFVLFTGNGEFTSNSASTTVTGDVGNLVGAVSAFPLGNLTGQKYFGGTVADQANTDIISAYDDIAGRTGGIVHGIGFGGETLAPGMYSSIAASTLNGDLTLDAGGNPAAIFIIRIDGAFTAASGSRVLLLGSASACNVYWQINGAVALNSTLFRGTMLVNGAISLNTGTTLNGRALTKTGALIFGDINATVCTLSLVPVKLEQFDISKGVNDNVVVSWQTTSEINLMHYEIEVSVNSSTFYKVGTVTAKGQALPSQYTFQDRILNKTGIRFYRLKMVDTDGLFTYSWVRSVKFSDLKTGQIHIFPNPASNKLNLSVSAETKEKVTVSIINMQGRKMMEKTISMDAGINNISENIQSLRSGEYIVIIKNQVTGTSSHKSFQKL